MFWVIGCIFFAAAQLLWAGYQLGVGNQSIQIPFVQKLHQPGLYGRDIMVEQTISRYPSYFYNAVAWLLHFGNLPVVFLVLQLVTAAAAMAGAAWLCRAMFAPGIGAKGEVWGESAGGTGGINGTGGLKPAGLGWGHWSGWAGLMLIVMLLSGQHMTLGGDGLYSAGFSHTWAAFAIGLAVLALFYSDRYWWAFVVGGLLFNVHALEAAYLGAFMGLATLMSIRRLGWWRVIGWWASYALAAGPALAVMFAMRQHFDGLWMMLMHARSATHSFPTSWWEVGNPDVPRFALMVGMAAAAMSLVPHAEPAEVIRNDQEQPEQTSKGKRRITTLRKTQWIAVAAGLLFAAGYVFTEVWPSAMVVRAQLYRCSRFIEVIALAYVAGGGVRAWGHVIESWRGRYTGRVKRPGLWIEAIVMTAAVLCLSLPAVAPLLPWVVLAGGLAALINGRLSWYAAVVVSASLLVCLIAHQMLHFVIPGLSPDFSWTMLIDLRLPGMLAMGAMAGGLLMWVIAMRRWRAVTAALMLVVGVAGATAVVSGAWGMWLNAGNDGDWVAAQQWAQQNTKTDALFLTPPQMGGFRIGSQRAVVGEWRDGTQLYFTAAFAVPWWDRMRAVQPGLVYNAAGTKMLARGKPLEQMDDQQVMALADAFHADYVVLPAARIRWMKQVYANEHWAIYRPRIPKPTPGDAAVAAQRRYIDQAVAAKIQRNRTSDVRVQVLDENGRPIADAKYQVQQVSMPFHFGATLGPMRPLPDSVKQAMDFVQAPVTDAQLAAFDGLFNFSVTGITGTWLEIESQRESMWWDDTDAYVDWCKKHNVAVELHFITGYEPPWAMLGRLEQKAWMRMRHTRRIVERYGDRIDYWEVLDNGVGDNEAAMLLTMLRKRLPNAKLGIAACVRFGSDASPATREQDMWRGLDLIRELKQKGIQLDFVSFHAHRPWGYWADARLMAQTIEAYANEGVRIHISQLGVPDHGPIIGTVREGQWTPELQAEYYADVMKVCFSEPSVDAINFEGLAADTLTSGAGLLDEHDQPKPAYEAVKRLITHDWRTHASGQLGLDGATHFRAFHGQCRLTITLGDGRTVTAPFNVTTDGANSWRFIWKTGSDKLEVQP